MMRGYEVTGFSRADRARRSRLILQEIYGVKMLFFVLNMRGGKRYARKLEFVSEIQGVARDLTPGPRGPGED